VVDKIGDTMKIAILPGDGIGEIIAQAVKVLNFFGLSESLSYSSIGPEIIAQAVKVLNFLV